MSINISKQKRNDLLGKIKEIRTFISSAPQDENTGNLEELDPNSMLMARNMDLFLRNTERRLTRFWTHILRY